MKEYKPIESEPLVAAEPAAAYGSAYVQGLKQRLIATINQSDDEERLVECMELLHTDTMPCVYTDEEFEEELRLSEASGNISHEEVLKYFAKWGFVR